MTSAERNEIKSNRPEDRRKEGRVPAAFPLHYYFVHEAEARNTKIFRHGATRDVSRYGVFFEAQVVDPTILPAAEQGLVQIVVQVDAPDMPRFEATCRLAWAQPVSPARRDVYYLGVEYTNIEHGDNEALYEAAIRAGNRA